MRALLFVALFLTSCAGHVIQTVPASKELAESFLLTSNPPGADVELYFYDGGSPDELGQTPLRLHLPKDVRWRCNLTVSKPGYETWTMRLETALRTDGRMRVCRSDDYASSMRMWDEPVHATLAPVLR